MFLLLSIDFFLLTGIIVKAEKFIFAVYAAERRNEMQNKSYEIDMCHGPLPKKLILFSLPLMLSGMLQLLFNAADVIVVGRFAGSEALAAVGSTGSLITLITNLFIGLSVGANVIVAHAFGTKNYKSISEIVHTAMLLSFVSGIFLAVIGVFIARFALELMSSPEDVIDLSALYLKIYFMGMPATLVYNFGSAILRAEGDTRRPLYILCLAGIVNVILNLFFVIVCNLSVAGVAIATVTSQMISAILIVRCLMTEKSSVKLDLRCLKIHKNRLIQILKVGLPAGLQGIVFSLSNIVMQSAINSFGSDTMAGNAAAASIEGFIYVAMNSFFHTSLTFTGQNYGAGQYKRVFKVFLMCISFVTVTGLSLGLIALTFGHTLLGIYSQKPSVISQGLIRMKYICPLYFLCGTMDAAVGSIRGLGRSMLPTITSLLGACIFRMIWIFTIFSNHHTLNCLYVIYPLSWGVTFGAHLVCFFVIYRKLVKQAISSMHHSKTAAAK